MKLGDRMTDQFTIEQVKHWIGSDATHSDLVGIIAEIANNKYPINVLRSDINGLIDKEVA